MQVFLIKVIRLKLQIDIDKDHNNTTNYTKLLGIYVIESILSCNLLENPLGIQGSLFVESRVNFWTKCLFSASTHRPIIDSVTPLESVLKVSKFLRSMEV